MNITIELTPEQKSALDSLTDDFNIDRNDNEKLDNSQYLQLVLLGIINDKVKSNFETAAKELVESSRQLPYEIRLQLINDVKSKINN